MAAIKTWAKAKSGPDLGSAKDSYATRAIAADRGSQRANQSGNATHHQVAAAQHRAAEHAAYVEGRPEDAKRHGSAASKHDAKVKG